MAQEKFSFEVTYQDQSARYGVITTPRGVIETPVFMPVGTQATVKAMDRRELEEIGASIVLSNTYHLMLRPGHDIIQRLGGLHRFMNWPHPILTDSGGYQVYSLAKLRKVTEEGVHFQSHLDGQSFLLSPERSMAVQQALGADIIMCFDECPAYPATEAAVRQSMELSVRWAHRCKQVHSSEHQALFGIIQGGMYPALRKQSLDEMLELNFEGYALGGLSVGEDAYTRQSIVEAMSPMLPTKKPRYVMGVGLPEDILECVMAGIDMFDCVIPTRHARNGNLFTSFGDLTISHEAYKQDERPIDPDCSCEVCRSYSRAYLRHLFMARELLSYRLNTLHNLFFYVNFTRSIRQAIQNHRLASFRDDFYARRRRM